jgi:glucosylceramidase
MIDTGGHFAEYLARFLEAYRDEGLEVHAITIQNEPEYNPTSYPTCGWSAAQQRDFIGDHLGPLFRARGLGTLIWCFDHNFNNPDFPATILRDSGAAQHFGPRPGLPRPRQAGCHVRG